MCGWAESAEMHKRIRNEFIETGAAGRKASRRDRRNGSRRACSRSSMPMSRLLRAVADAEPPVDHRARAVAERDRTVAREDFPETWEAQPIVRTKGENPTSAVTTVTGLGVSPGVVEGRVRLILDAADDVDIDNGDILVCPATDPSWVS